MMKLVIDYADDAKEKLGMTTDSDLSKHLGGSRGLVTQWRTEGKVPDDYYCIRIGQILGIDPLIVISAANFQREKSTERKAFWENFNSGRTGKILGTALIAGMLATPSPEGVKAETSLSYSGLTTIVYIM
ncbi:hypothetical protein [Janthinobacterium sp. B9-8]|uniref:hypothetical protein n=1 Tax=Janthinobacterium sp. B9-8 TaxID=1236179 RepID=UPI0012E3F89D|nr:hypothetical protein [Janthinobacterium sp. B9-8]